MKRSLSARFHSAAAEWKRAESERFIVYSEGPERELRAYVQKLETFDYIVRFKLEQSPAAPPRKFPIYLVRNRAELMIAYPEAPTDLGGVYFPTDEDVFALSMTGGDHVILHEYFHHLSIATGELAAYPGWLIEGLAEYYATADVLQSRVTLGGTDPGTIYALTSIRQWIPLQTLLGEAPTEINRTAIARTYYPVAWLLTHWIMNDETRRPMLDAYIAAVGAGGDPVETIQQVTGMDLETLQRELKDYLDGKITLTRYSFQRAPAEITVTTLPASADDLLLLGQRLKIQVPEEGKAKALADVRAAAARHPDDPFALLVLGRAELHLGDAAAGEAVLTRLLEMEPANVEALQLLGNQRMQEAMDLTDYQAQLAKIRESRAFLARAYQADPTHFYTLELLAQTRQWSQSYPNENDLATWESAFILAPQLPNIRFGYARALMQADKNEEAIVLMTPIANAPHNPGQAAAAQQMIDRARAGQAPLSDETLDDVSEEQPEPVDAS